MAELIRRVIAVYWLVPVLLIAMYKLGGIVCFGSQLIFNKQIAEKDKRFIQYGFIAISLISIILI